MKKPTTSYLEYIAGFASPSESFQPENEALFSRVMKYYLQSLARELLPNEKVAKCARMIRPNKYNVEVVHVPDTKKAYFRNLIICGRVWTCPVCAAKVNERRRQELAALVYQSPYMPILVTYTIQHQRHYRLNVLVSALQGAMRRIKSGKAFKLATARWGIVGSVRGFEVTHGRSGWHPHIHELMLIDPDNDDETITDLQTWLRDHWNTALKQQGQNADWSLGVKITRNAQDIAEYIAKHGHEPAYQHWGVTHELVKSNHKQAADGGKTPFDLLFGYGNGNLADGRKFQEYARVMKNLHPLHWTKGLRALLLATMPEQTDEQVAADDPEPYIVLAKLERDAWKIILGKDRRAALLNVASTGDQQAVIAWLAAQGIEHVDLNDLI